MEEQPVVGDRTYVLWDVALEVEFDGAGGGAAAQAETAGYAEHVGVDRNDRFAVED